MSLRPSAEIAGSKSSSGSKQASGQSLKTGWGSAGGTQESSACFVHAQPGFRWTAADAYLFDIDGTLLNSRDAVHYHAFHRAVSQVYDLNLQLDGIPVHGNTDVGILRAYLETSGIPEDNWRARIPEALAVMSAEVERNADDLRPEVCPAVPELIQRLKAQGKLLGVASGNLEAVGWAKLQAARLRDYFSFGAFSGKLEKRDDVIADGIRQAQAISGRSAIVYVVGDTPADIRSAHANGIAAIAVATGIYGFDELLSHAPEMCVSCCRDLLTTYPS